MPKATKKFFCIFNQLEVPQKSGSLGLGKNGVDWGRMGQNGIPGAQKKGEKPFSPYILSASSFPIGMGFAFCWAKAGREKAKTKERATKIPIHLFIPITSFQPSYELLFLPARAPL